MTNPVVIGKLWRECPFCRSDQIDEQTHMRKWSPEGGNVFQAFVECWECGARGPQTAWYDKPDAALNWLRKMPDDENWNAAIRKKPIERAPFKIEDEAA